MIALGEYAAGRVLVDMSFKLRWWTEGGRRWRRVGGSLFGLRPSAWCELRELVRKVWWIRGYLSVWYGHGGRHDVAMAVDDGCEDVEEVMRLEVNHQRLAKPPGEMPKRVKGRAFQLSSHSLNHFKPEASRLIVPLHIICPLHIGKTPLKYPHTHTRRCGHGTPNWDAA